MELPDLKSRLEEEEAAYRALLDALDKIASFRIPGEAPSELPSRLSRLNELWQHPAPGTDSGMGSPVRAQARRAVAPALERQQEFNAALVQLLNERVAETDALHARLRELVSTLVRYLQRILPLVDARDRIATALATTRSELILEAFDRRLESMARRLEGLLAMRDALGSLREEVSALSAGLAVPPQRERAAAAVVAAEDSRYVAFENRFRGEREDIRLRLRDYATLFEGLSPVVDLGCGRGEFLEILKEKAIAARGVEGNARVAQECRDRGLDVVTSDLVEFLAREKSGSLGGVFAAQVAEHLPPKALQEVLAQAYRSLRAGGLLLLETVNPRSVVAFLEIFNRDLTHEKPLHPETLSFLTAAAGFTDVRVELRSPVDATSRLQPIPAESLSERTAAALNENVERLNALLYGHQEYVLLARR